MCKYVYVVCVFVHVCVCEYIIQLAVQPIRSFNISFQLKRILREEKTRCRQTNKNNNKPEQEIVERAAAKLLLLLLLLLRFSGLSIDTVSPASSGALV